MASAFTHAFVALAAGRLCTSRRVPARFWILAAACSILPDIDAIGFALGLRYGHLLGHRGLTHSLLFAALVGAAASRFAFRDASFFPGKRAGLAAFFAAVTASHGVLDALTNGGYGIAFFSPFVTTRYFLPWTPIQVSPIGIGSFFSEWGVRVMASELLWVWAPVGALAAAVEVVRRRRAKNPAGNVLTGSPGDDT
jgi:inner membrane protein